MWIRRLKLMLELVWEVMVNPIKRTAKKCLRAMVTEFDPEYSPKL